VTNYDIIIVGGAAIGSSIAAHIAADPAFDGKILVIEKDPSYQRCASALSAASIRQQFSSKINIAISLYGIAFLRDIGTHLAVDEERPEISLREGGYLFLATKNGAGVLRENYALQTQLGADILLLPPDQLRDRFPWLNTDGLALGSWGRTGEGWFDGYALMQAYRRKARSLGVTYVAAQAASLERNGSRIEAVRLNDGTSVACGALVNCAGTGAATLARTVGVDLPIRPKKRMIFTFECRTEIRNCPLLIDPTGVYCRPEGKGFIGGSAPPPEQDPDSDDFEVDHTFFEEVVWPVLAARIPAFESIKQGRAWAGHYDMNLFDHNAFLGPVSGSSNFYIANGFSGHGLQQSPAIGRGLAELLVHGHYRSLDLSPLHMERLIADQRLIERNVV
jgi:glycine/D-amino acid oxidase-like deaminating enzyme